MEEGSSRGASRQQTIGELTNEPWDSVFSSLAPVRFSHDKSVTNFMAERLKGKQVPSDHSTDFYWFIIIYFIWGTFYLFFPFVLLLRVNSPPAHTHTHRFFFLTHMTQPRSTHAPSTFYFCDHNYLMMEPLVSPPCFCTHDLAVNYLARGARTVVYRNSRWRQETRRAGFLVIHVALHAVHPSLHLPPLIRRQCFLLMLSWKRSFLGGLKLSRCQHGETSEETESTAWRHQAQKGEEIYRHHSSRLSCSGLCRV